MSETYMIYVLSQHLSFTKKWGHQWIGGGGNAYKKPSKNAMEFAKSRL